jgi:hypothetical protein
VYSIFYCDIILVLLYRSMLCFEELTSKLKNALASTPKDVADSGRSDSCDLVVLKESLRTFCIESKEDFAVSQLRAQESKDSFIAVVLCILKKFCPNSEWTTELDGFFRDFEETMDDRYGIIAHCMIHICYYFSSLTYSLNLKIFHCM